MPEQERQKILKIIAEEILANGTLKLSQLGNVLERNGFSRDLYAGKLKRWVINNFQDEVEIIGSNGKETLSVSSALLASVSKNPLPESISSAGTTNAALQTAELTRDVRQRFYITLKEQLDTYGMLLHSSIPGLIPDWSRYRIGSEKLGSWLTRVFTPDEFVSRIVNNAAALFFPHAARDIDRIVQLSMEMIQSAGMATVASIAAELNRENLNWQSIPIAHNQTLGEWLTDYCPAVTYTDASETALRFVREEDSDNSSPITDLIKQDIVYRYIFLPAAGAPLTALREILNDSTYTSPMWKKQSVNVCFDNLMGLGEGFLDDSDGDEPRMAFNTGLQTPEQQHIYCIVVPNEVASAAQPWRGSIFRYPGQNDPEGYGKWLCQRFGLASENQDIISLSYQNIENAVDEIEALEPSLLEQVAEESGRIRLGNPIDPGFTTKLVSYSRQWDIILNSLQELGVTVGTGDSMLTQVREILNNRNNISAVLDSMKADYLSIVAGAWDFMDNRLGALMGQPEPDRDITRWDTCLAEVHMSEEETRTVIGRLLQPFHGMRTLARSTWPIGDQEEQVLDIIEKHFNARIRIRDVRDDFIGAEEGTFDFLNKLDEIEKRLKRLKLLKIHKKSAAVVEKPRMQIRKLVELMMAEPNSAALIGSHYPQLNAFEAAVVCGDFAQAKLTAKNTEQMAAMGYSPAQQETIAQEIGKVSRNYSTPILTAAKNLELVQGNANRQAEKYYLMAVALKDGEAAGALADLYYRENNAQLLQLVYNAHGQRFSLDMRQRHLCLLISRGLLQIPEVIDTDLLGFLSNQDPAALDDFCWSSQLSQTQSENLIKLRRVIEEPFIRQIVFLDGELFRFIQQPENIETIRLLGIDQTQESLGELLRSGSYPRGRDALSTGRRLWHFVRDWDGLAEDVISLSSDSDQKTELLWDIYQLRKDDAQLLRLMRQTPALQSRNPEAYSDLLFDDGAYQDYFALFSNMEKPTVRMQLQFMISAIRIGQWDGCIPGDLAPEELERNADLVMQLTRLLTQTGRISEFCGFMQLYFEPLLFHCGRETVRQLLTADDQMDRGALLHLQEQAIRDDHTMLAIFLFQLLEQEDSEHYCQTYCESLLQQLRTAAPEEQAQTLRKLELLFPMEYRQHYYQVFPYLLRSKLSSAPSRTEQTAATVEKMFTADCIVEQTLPSILAILKEFSMACHTVVLERLPQLCNTPALQKICLEFYHTNADAFEGMADGFLCTLYRNALEQDTLPQDCLEAAEKVALRRISATPDDTPLWCVNAIEQRRGREIYQKFTQLCAQTPGEEESSESEDVVTELSLLRQVLADPACDIGEYLEFCSHFNLFSAEDQQSVEPLLVSGQEGALTEAESIPLLHGLYCNSQDSQYLAACARLPFRDTPAAFARLLHYCALSSEGSGISWKACTDYCDKFRLDDMLITVLLSQLQQIRVSSRNLQWYDGKELFNTVRLLCSRPEGFPRLSNPGSVRQLLEELCDFFLLIDTENTTSNHTSLRSIIELAVFSGNEDIVTKRLMDKLLGAYKKLYLAFACHLLQQGSYENALLQFQALSRCHAQIPYKALIDALAQEDAAGLEAWAGKESSRMLLRYFLLPDGNRPDTQMLRYFVMACITQNKQEVGIEVAEHLIRYFETDAVCYKVLFILCKENYLDHLPQIQQALMGLYIHYSLDRRSNYSRSHTDILGLLTIVTAVMEHLHIPGRIQNISEFIQDNTSASPNEKSRRVMSSQDMHSAIISDLKGHTHLQSKVRIYCLMGCVTGSWEKFFEMAYTMGTPEEELKELLQNSSCCVWGLARCALAFGKTLSDEERARYMAWLSKVDSLIDPHQPQFRLLKTQLNHAYSLAGKNNLDDVPAWFLALPWEEHLVCVGEIRDDVGNRVDSCFTWMIRQLPGLDKNNAIKPMLHIYHRIGQDAQRDLRLFNESGRLFREGEFALAAEIYDVLNTAYVIPRYVGDLSPAEIKVIKMEYREQYQALTRICKVFLGDNWAIEKFRTMRAHSCGNIVVTLLQSPYAGKLEKVAQYFVGENRQLCAAILKLVNPALSDEEKFEIYHSFNESDDAQAALAKILSSKAEQADRYLFLQHPKDAQMKELQELIRLSAAGKAFVYLGFRKPVPTYALSQSLDLTVAPAEAVSAGLPDEMVREGDPLLPAFAQKAHDDLREQELPTLETLRQQSLRCAFDDYAQKLSCAQAIYHLTSQEFGAYSNHTITALVQFSQEYRNYRLSRLSGSDTLTDGEKLQLRTQARQAVMEMASYLVSIPSGQYTSPSRIQYEDQLLAILCNDFGSIDELLADYQRNRDGYYALLQLLSDNAVRSIAVKIMEEIRYLAQRYETSGPKDQNSAAYRVAYKKAYDALEQLPFHMSWNEAKNTLLKHLMRAINSLDKRPYLNVRILNDRKDLRQGVITGVLTNTGRLPAENICVQVIYGDANTLSDTYGYEELLPNEQICFAVEYSTEETTAFLSYKLNITYSYRDKEYTVDPRTGTLEMIDRIPLTQDIDLYGAHKELIFTTNEQGDVVGKGFYGRNTEKQDLQKLASEAADFSDYRSAVIQGFRRTGKTSLLHYFMEHVRSKCGSKAVAIYVDCEGFVNQPIQKAFVTSVLFGLENEMPELTERESWHRLKNAWTLTDSTADRDPDTLQFFYQSLGRELDGKGVILILDEVDRLFARVEENQGAASSLFPSLRAVQHNPNCKKAVHMLMCGSNNMLIYNQDGGKLYQLFEDFAKIRVGRLHKNDIQQLLEEPLAEAGDMHYHPDAIEWIWRYTGGLVWYTKLLGNAAVNQAKSKSRRCIYPIDVSIAFDTIINEQNCKQYIDEGCNDDARLVLDAFATLSTRFGTEVSRSQLLALLDGALSENQLDSSLKLLSDTLGLLDHSVNARNSYRFAVEIYRRFYRTQQTRFQRTEAPADRMSLTALSPAAAVASQRKTLKKRN